MKNLILFIILLCIARSAAAQTRVTDLSQSALKGKVKSVTAYTFRAEDHMVPDTTGSAEKTIETFDEKGWAIDEKMYKNDKLTQRFSFEYSGDSVAVMNQFDGSGKLYVKYIYRYDSQGKETEFDMTSDAQPQIRLAKINYRCIYEYDQSGNRITQNQYIDYDRLTMRAVFKYDAQNKRIQSDDEWFFGKTIKASKTIYAYDDAGNLIKSDTYDADGKLTGGNEIAYAQFDKYGNWLMVTSSNRGHSITQGDYIFTHITKRVIEYYE